MTHLFHRQTSADMPVAVSGHGPYIVDAAGKHYLDACGGAAVSCLGHDHAAVKEAIKQQLDHIAWAHSGFFSSPPAEELGTLLANLAPGDINHVYLLSGGSEAVEAALKLARQFHLERGATEKSEIIARRQSYHGNTLGALAAGGNIPRKQPFLPLMSANMHHIGPCYYWRWAEAGESEFDYGQRMANELADKIQELGPENVAAFIAEPVVGATLGAVPAVDGYFARIREICDQNDVLLILDEVMCGMGRTGRLFAYEISGVAPDVMALAKGLGSGFPVGAVLASEKGASGMSPGTHGSTYGGNPMAMAAGNAVLDVMLGGGFLDTVKENGAYLREQLEAVVARHPKVVESVRGVALMQGLKCIKPNLEMMTATREAGLLTVVAGDNVLRILPPLTVSKSEIDEAVGYLDTAFAGAAE